MTKLSNKDVKRLRAWWKMEEGDPEAWYHIDDETYALLDKAITELENMRRG